MRTLTQILKRNLYGAAALLLLAASVAPVLLASNASAAQVTARSIQMSSATPSATAQTYLLTFTPATTVTVKGIVVDFCNSATGPLIGTSCTLPTSMTVGSTLSAPSAGSWSGSVINSSHSLLISDATGTSLPAATPWNITVSGFTNPSTTGTFYARILTFTDDTVAAAYVSNTPGAYTDYGGVALSTTASVSVTAAVQESLTFCVSAADPGAGCSGATTPSLTLGTGSPPVLSTSAVDTAAAYFQVSTNAAGSTVVKLRNSAASGGLNSGSNSIPPVNHATTPQAIVAGTAKFGVKLGTAGGTGTLTPSTVYADASNYNMRTTEVTSTYGDTIATGTGPLSDAEVPMTFGATIGNTTAAGIYTAAISLIATSSY